jgi:hypothetical protein
MWIYVHEAPLENQLHCTKLNSSILLNNFTLRNTATINAFVIPTKFPLILN